MKFLFGLLFWGVFESWGTISYLPGTEDIPLIEGVVEIENPTLFDSPQGKVVISKVVTSLEKKDVKSFYKEVLPNLGWREISENKYKRETQLLKINIEDLHNKTVIVFELTQSFEIRH